MKVVFLKCLNVIVTRDIENGREEIGRGTKKKKERNRVEELDSNLQQGREKRTSGSGWNL